MTTKVKHSPLIGVLEWFRPGEYEQVERVLADLQDLGVTQLRTGVSWADWHKGIGQEWYRWLLPRLAQSVEILPCFLYTPPSLGVVPKTASPPRQAKAYADFIDQMIAYFGEYFEWVELWNEPNNVSEWDWTLDPEWWVFSEMIGGAAYWAQQRGKKTLLAGMSPVDPNWLRLMGDRGVLAYIDAVGIHGFPGNWEYAWAGWRKNIERVQAVLAQYQSSAQVWITETGFSTWQYDEHRQLREFLAAINTSVERVYWYAARDLNPHLSTVDGFHTDEREYHFGLKQTDGNPKLLSRLWANGGLPAVRQVANWAVARAESTENAQLLVSDAPILITGGSGFIGSNLADHFLRLGQPVLLFDNLSRPGVERNYLWLRARYGDLVQIVIADVRDRFALRQALLEARQVFHLAAQVAVTTSLTNPQRDFEINAMGTLNLLEELRSQADPPPLVFTSTNKVYGTLANLELVMQGDRYQPIAATQGINEAQPLDFHSPYGCSKGAAEQYVLDYARNFGIPAVVLRLSCIYGPQQLGTEDQGWVAHFLKQAIADRPITLYGDGKQVRDILFITDLIAAFCAVQQQMPTLSGQAFNLGGGWHNTTSLLELMALIGELHGKQPQLQFQDWRTGDQRYYVADFGKFQAATSWTPKVSIRQGVQQLYQWLLATSEPESEFSALYSYSPLTHQR